MTGGEGAEVWRRRGVVWRGWNVSGKWLEDEVGRGVRNVFQLFLKTVRHVL